MRFDPACTQGLLSADDFTGTVDPQLPLRLADSRRSEFGQQKSLGAVSPMFPDASVTYLSGRSVALKAASAFSTSLWLTATSTLNDAVLDA
jgi:hypothetical protein